YSFKPKFLERNGYDKIGDLKQLYPTGSDRAKWEKIGFPGNDVGDASDMKDDGDNPSEPTSVNHSNNTLTWNKSSSTDVVGYYIDRKSTRLNSSHVSISYAVFCLKKKKVCNREYMR